jgi:CAAX prenyl protease-like protein
VVVPFIYYLLGTMVGGYLETMRESYVAGKLDELDHDEGHRPPVEEDDADRIEVKPTDTYLLGMLPLEPNSYPYTYTFNIAVTTVMVLLVSWGYFRAPFRISGWAVVVGVVGVVAWIGLAYLDKQFIGLGEWISGGRTAYNPFDDWKDTPHPFWQHLEMWQFLAIRFYGLVLVVPLIEEFFVRGFLMRYVDDPDWDELPLGQAKLGGWLAPTIYGVVAHMTEPLAALVWFSMVSWLYRKTGSIWDCVLAHAVTNLLLGIYIVKFGAWHLW